MVSACLLGADPALRGKMMAAYRKGVRIIESCDKYAHFSTADAYIDRFAAMFPHSKRATAKSRALLNEKRNNHSVRKVF